MIMSEFEDPSPRVRENMSKRKLAIDSVYLSDLPVGQHRDLLDLAQLANKPTTIEDLFPFLN